MSETCNRGESDEETMLCEVWRIDKSGTLEIGIQHLYEAKLCETKPDPHYRADAQEQLHGHHRPTRPDGDKQQGRVLPMSEKMNSDMWDKAVKALDEMKDWYVFDPSKDEPIKFREPTQYGDVNDTKEDKL